jgi:hypothetical protein
MRQGNYGAAALDMLAVIPGGGALGAGLKDARAAVTVGKDLKVLGGVSEAAAKEGGAGKALGEACNLFNSFTPDTPVLLASSKRVRIDQVKVGDKVLAQDPKTGRQATEPVERIIIGQGLKHLVTIGVPGERLVATDAHPFYVRQAHDFVTAGQLQAGEQLELSTGTWVTIASVQHKHEMLRVYNLSVGELHTFFAGDTSVLVHNCGNAAISMDEAVERGASHVGGKGTMMRTPGRNWQFVGERFQNAAGQSQRNIARFDLSNLDEGEAPHLNLEVQLNGKPQPWLDPHTPIDISTARPGDF